MKLLKPHLLGFTLLASILRSGTRIEGEEFCRADLCEFQRTHFEDDFGGQFSEDKFRNLQGRPVRNEPPVIPCAAGLDAL